MLQKVGALMSYYMSLAQHFMFLLTTSETCCVCTQIGEMTGDLVAAGAVDLEAMAQHVLQAGEPAEEGEWSCHHACCK